MSEVIVISDPQKVAELLAPLVAQQLATRMPAAQETGKKRLVTLKQAEEIYGLKRTTAWELRKKGVLKNYGTGKTIRLSVDEIETLNSSNP